MEFASLNKNDERIYLFIYLFGGGGESQKKCASSSTLGVSKYCSAIYMSAAKFVLIFLYIWAICYHDCVNAMSNQLL